MKDFKEKLALVPNKPGSYQMRDKDGVIIYVGKAKNLKIDWKVISPEHILVKLYH